MDYKVLPPCVLYACIGQGGMGAVYRGHHLNLGIDIAVKCLKPVLVADDPAFVARFEREARSAACITHQNVIRVFDVAEHEGLHYLIMEYVQGENARQRVERKGPLPVGQALHLVHAASLGLGEAHRMGIVHRDIKPDNLMVSTRGQVKVADLGLAKPATDSRGGLLSMPGQVLGTPSYMPPEQWSEQPTTSATDVWAMGAVLYFLLTGRDAIQGSSLTAIMNQIVLQEFPDVRVMRPDLPESVTDLLRKATAKDPGERYLDANELAKMIAALPDHRVELIDDGEGAAEACTLVSRPSMEHLDEIKRCLRKGERQSGPEHAISRGASSRTRFAVTRAPFVWLVGALVLLLAGSGWALRDQLFSTNGSLPPTNRELGGRQGGPNLTPTEKSRVEPAPRTLAARITEIQRLMGEGRAFEALLREYELWDAHPETAGSDREGPLVDAVWEELDVRLMFDRIAPVKPGQKVKVSGKIDPVLPLNELLLDGVTVPIVNDRFEALLDQRGSRWIDVVVRPVIGHAVMDVASLEYVVETSPPESWTVSFRASLSTDPPLGPDGSTDREQITVIGTTSEPELIVLINSKWFADVKWLGNTFRVEVPLPTDGPHDLEVMVRHRDEQRGPTQRLHIVRRPG
jgi:serine/threonine protein kinase